MDIACKENNIHRTKSHVSVFLKRGGNMQRHVSVMFASCGNVEIQVYVIPSRFRNGNAKSRFRQISASRFPPLFVSVMFLQTDLQFFATSTKNTSARWFFEQ